MIARCGIAVVISKHQCINVISNKIREFEEKAQNIAKELKLDKHRRKACLTKRLFFSNHHERRRTNKIDPNHHERRTNKIDPNQKARHQNSTSTFKNNHEEEEPIESKLNFEAKSE